jgi:WD40 repeat protein
MAISADNKYLATGGFDSKISLFNIATGEKLLNIFTPFGLDFVAADTNGNYLVTKNL